MPVLPFCRRRSLATLSRLFDERFMGLLAILALATALMPMVFDLSPEIERVLTGIEWFLVAAFAAEFVFQGVVAVDRAAWIRSPWRVVDLVTVLGPFVSLLPQVSELARGSLMLRMLRLVRAVAFGTRAGVVAGRQSAHAIDGSEDLVPRVQLVGEDGIPDSAAHDWNSFVEWAPDPRDGWMHASDVHRRHFQEAATAAGIPNQEIVNVLDVHGHAKIRQLGDRTAIVLDVPTVAESGFPAVHGDRVLAIVSPRGVMTATTGALDLHAELLPLIGSTILSHPSFPARVGCVLLSMVSARNQYCAQRFDEEVHRLEAEEGGGDFLRDSFRLRREMAARALDLWHVSRVARALANGKAMLAGIDLRDEKALDNLLGEMESLYETLDKEKEEVKALIEHHINLKSFEMNKFLRLLAVVSFLGLIPSVVGGMLGMNVMGNPWPVTLGQVVFGVAMSMAVSLYVFAVKGWLR
jgi:Mg2+ and Co2+ transporter CorA